MGKKRDIINCRMWVLESKKYKGAHMYKIMNEDNNTSLKIVNKNFVDIIKKNKISNFVESFKKEICLSEVFLGACLDLEKNIIDNLHKVDKLKIRIKKDSFGVEELAVFTSDDVFLGFVAVNYVEVIKNLMQAGKQIIAKVVCAEHIVVDVDFSFSRVKVKLVMVDY